jgi:hypothetical protein
MGPLMPRAWGMFWTLLTIVFIFWVAWPAMAHEHYPRECCSDKDCHAVAASAVKKVGDTWHVMTEDGELTFEAGKVREPLDDQFHACWHPGSTWTFCFFPASGGV